MDKRQNGIHKSLYKPVGVIAVASIFFNAAGKMGFGLPHEEAVAAATEIEPVALSNTAGLAISELTEEQLRAFLQDRGFRNLDKSPLHQMRRMYLLWHYMPLFDHVSAATGISNDVLFAYFVIEATREGVESELMQKAFNPGGVKHHGRYEAVYAFDDCSDTSGKPIPCAFENPGTFENAVKLWAEVFNAPRYKDCKSLSAKETCKCLYENGYHGSNNYKSRARLAGDYHKYKEENLPFKSSKA